MPSGLDELVWEFGNYWRTYLTDYIYNDTDIMNTAELCEFLRDLGRQKGNLTCDIVCLQFSGSAKEERKGTGFKWTYWLDQQSMDLCYSC